MIMKFINRKRELEFLNKAFASKQAELIILYGRRRVGKTELLLHFAKGKPYVYFQASETSEKDNLHNLYEKIGEHFKEDLGGFQETWENLFKFLAGKKGRFALIIDEFPYLVVQNDAISSIFQGGWDEHLKNSDIMLVLNGSSVSMMEEHTLFYKAPLYGRRTGQWKVETLPFGEISHFFPKYSMQEIIETYGAVDSIPAYLAKFDQSLGVWENVRQKLMTKGTFLYDEADFLLKQEFREPKVYKNCLKSIALGHTKLSEILSSTATEQTKLSIYLDTLGSLGIIEKRTPLLDPPNSKRGRYHLKDNFFKFYFRYSLPNRSSIEEGKLEPVLSKIKEDYPNYIGRSVFEGVCKQYLQSTYDHLPFEFQKIGSQWGAYTHEKETKAYEIDIVAINGTTNDIFFAECKWSDDVDAKAILGELKGKTEHVPWQKEKRKEHFAIFAKSFKHKEYLGANIALYDLKDLERVFRH